MNIQKYKSFPTIPLQHRQWPNHTLTQAPIWCSVDLRDGNQALIEPMGLERKNRCFDLLVSMGYKEIEVGFPAASKTDYDFVRYLIEEDKVPCDITLQVLTQARAELIDRTFKAIQGAKRVIVHLYNSTSEVQRRLVFGMDRPKIIDIARQGMERIVAKTQTLPSETEIVFQYSPESFTATELDFSIEICEVMMDICQPTKDCRMILNLPATVEVATPNIYADQIEFFQKNIRHRETFILSIHPHNDRGTAVAAAELAMLAGAERIEGTLFGNGERTGNVDLVLLALNLYTQGIDPGICIKNIKDISRVYEYCNQLPIHPRHPYAGDLVFTAFSGSHQDAIKKGLAAQKNSNKALWEVPYLPIDPKDIGRTYEAVIRINSQSGKSGIAYIMKRDFGIDLPRRLQFEFSDIVQKVSDKTGKEIHSKQLWELFRTEYLERKTPITLLDLKNIHTASEGHTEVFCQLMIFDKKVWMKGHGNGPVDAFINGLYQIGIQKLHLIDFSQHAITKGADAQAVAFIELEGKEPDAFSFGVALDASIVMASLKGIVSALNRLAEKGHIEGIESCVKAAEEDIA